MKEGGGLPQCHGGLKHETLLQRVEVRVGPGRGTTHAGADATETSCQPVGNRARPEGGDISKGKTTPRVDCMSHKHRGMEEWQ